MNSRKPNQQEQDDAMLRPILWIMIAIGCAILVGLFDELGYYSDEVHRAQMHGCITLPYQDPQQ